MEDTTILSTLSSTQSDGGSDLGEGSPPPEKNDDGNARHLLFQKRKYANEMISRCLVSRYDRKKSLLTTGMPWMVGYNPFLQGYSPSGRQSGDLVPLFDSRGMFSTLLAHKDDIADFCLDIFFQWRFFRNNPVKNHSPNALFDSWNEFRRLVLQDGDAVLQTLHHRRDIYRHSTLGEMMEIHELSMQSTGICGIERKYRCPMCYSDTACIELKLMNGRYAGFAYDTPDSLTSRIVNFKNEKEGARSNQALRRLSEALNEVVDLQLVPQALSHIESWIKRNTVSSEPAPMNALQLVEQQLTRVRRNSEQYKVGQIMSLNESILAIKNQQAQDRERIESCSNAIVALLKQKQEASPNQHLLDTCTNMLKKHARDIEQLKSTVQENMEAQESLSSHSTMILSNASMITQLMDSVQRIEQRLPVDQELALLDVLDAQLSNVP